MTTKINFKDFSSKELVTFISEASQLLETRLNPPVPAPGLIPGSSIPFPLDPREEVIKFAKQKVEELSEDTVIKHEGYRRSVNVEFIINKDKRTVVAILRGIHSKKIYKKGIAKCEPGDCFNTHIGKVIALHRALGKPVPKELLDAPQPERPSRAGDIVEYNGKRFEIIEPTKRVFPGLAHERSVVGLEGKIVDDSKK